MGSVDFQKWIDELREMPSGASQWEFAPRFIEEMTRIVAEKEIERSRIAEVHGAIRDIKDEFSEELEFLKLHDGLSALTATAMHDKAETVLEKIESLRNSLVIYRAKREMIVNSSDHETLIQNIVKLNQIAESSKTHFYTLRDFFEGSPPLDAPQKTPPTEGETPTTFPEGVEESEIKRSNSEPEGDAAAQEQDSEQDSTEVDAPNDPETQEDEHSGASLSQVQDIQVARPATEDVQDSSDDVVAVDESTASESSTVTLAGKVKKTASDASGESTALPVGEIIEPIPASEERRYGIEDSGVAAKHYLKTSSLHDLEALMWTLVAEDDLSAAYWVACHLSEQNYEDVVTPDLLKAVQGARWLTPDSHRYVSALSEFAQEYGGANGNAAQELLELAASLHSSLIAPHSNMWGLLETPDACPSAGAIVSTIDEFARYGHALRPEYIESMGESVRHQDDIIAASREAIAWLESADARRYSTFQPATNVWMHLTGEGGAISELLAPVKDDDRTQVRSVRESIEDDLDDLLDRTGRSLADGLWMRITGRARNWLINGITEAQSLAERWCELVEYEREVRAGARDDYLIGQATNLRSELQRQSSQFIEALCELITDSNPADIASAAQCALRSMEQVLQSLDINIDVEIPPAAAIVSDLTTINKNAGSHNLSVAVSRRLLWTDSANFKDDGLWEGKSLNEAIHSLAKGVAVTMPLAEAIQRRFDVQDFRFCEAMMEGSLTVEQKENLKNSSKIARQDSLVTLKRHAEVVKERVNQAARDGVIEIDDDYWILYDLEISEITDAVDAEEEILNYVSMSIQLQNISEGVGRLECQRQKDLQDEWNKTFSDLVENQVPAVQAWLEKFEAAQDNHNIRVMEECVIRLNSYSLGEPLPDSDADDVSEAPGQKTVAEFAAFVDSIPDIERHVQNSGGLDSLLSRFGLS